MSLYGVGLNVEVRKIHFQMKLALYKNGGGSVGQLRNLFK